MSYSVRVTLPLDHEGMLGQECPNAECARYFKVRIGPGLETDTCHCPYCGHAANYDDFTTQDQIRYVESVATERVLDSFTRDLNQTFKRIERRSRNNLISFSVKVEGRPISRYRYFEPRLETQVACDNCGLEFSIFGVFASCPDCQRLNALTTPLSSLEISKKRISLLDDPPLIAQSAASFH